MTGQRTGLIVEDEALLRLELAEELTAAGWRMREASSGEEALRFLSRLGEAGEQLDFLVTDIRLGGAADGWLVAEEFRKAWPGLVVIYVSANPISESRRMAGSLFLSKPVDIQTLIAGIRGLFAAGA